LTPATGRASTREAIFAAAAELFERDGFAATGVREIATAAGVTPALVIRYYGSKEQLFLATMELDNALTSVLLGPLNGVGAALSAFLLTNMANDQRGGVFSALMRASDRAAVRESLQRSRETTIVAPLTPRLAGPHAELRARLVAAQITGLLCALELVPDVGLADAEPETVSELFAATIQHLIDGPS
jgi:AcrR family transcriptional regulator